MLSLLAGVIAVILFVGFPWLLSGCRRCLPCDLLVDCGEFGLFIDCVACSVAGSLVLW